MNLVSASSRFLAAPLSLHLQPPPQALAYAATLSWERYANGEYQRSTIRKDVRLLVQANQTGYTLDFQLENPELTQREDPEALEEMALHLAALYARIVVQAAPHGRSAGAAQPRGAAASLGAPGPGNQSLHDRR